MAGAAMADAERFTHLLAAMSATAGADDPQEPVIDTGLAAWTAAVPINMVMMVRMWPDVAEDFMALIRDSDSADAAQVPLAMLKEHADSVGAARLGAFLDENAARFSSQEHLPTLERLFRLTVDTLKRGIADGHV